MQKTISIVIPVYNEEKNIPAIYLALKEVLKNLNYNYEIIYVNDGSDKDNSQIEIEKISRDDDQVKYIEFSRNFGKEYATTAGISHAIGDAVLTIDSDLQHPVSLIPDFIKKWENGIEVVIGIRDGNKGQTFIKKICSNLYYKIINLISDTPIQSGATDYRLLDRKVVDEFNKLSEHNRMTRGLIDWMGYKRDFINFVADKRKNGNASYSFIKLIKLAISSAISHSLVPLKIAGYLGIFTTIFFGIIGAIVFTERYLYNDVLGWYISGTAQLGILLAFFAGIMLICLGLIALYIGNIYNEVSGRPLYIIRNKK